MATLPVEHALAALVMEEANAWADYLEATRGQTAERYREIEPWAWSRLGQKLRAIRARRKKLASVG